MNQEKSRVKNATRNVVFSVITQIITLLFSFLTRTVFIWKLNSSYLGLSGLFTNILSILSIADLGFDTAIIYSMYKPIAEGNENKVAGLMNYFKKVYCIIGCIVCIIGLIFMPFLRFIVNIEMPLKEIYIYYILYLINTVITYFLANRVAIINADQKMYIVKRYTAVFKTLMSICQIISLYIFKSFTIYLLIQLAFTLLINIYGAYKSKKLYPFLKKNRNEITKNEKKDILKNVKSMLIYKIGGVILSNTDNILISIIISTQMVGIYDNYNTIIVAVTSLTSIFFNAMVASVGNLNTTNDNYKKEQVLKKLELLSAILYGFCSACLITLSNDFIKILWGNQYVSNMYVLIAAVLNFELVGLLYPIRLFRETSGLFKEIKYIFIWTSVLNLIFSVILGTILKPFNLSLFGIIIATAIARCMTTFWFEPYKLYNSILKKSSKGYFKRKFIDIVKIIFVVLLNILIFNNFSANSILYFIIKTIVVFIFNILLFVFLYKDKEEFKYFIDLIFKKFNKIKKQ